jgi:hypothetical protein
VVNEQTAIANVLSGSSQKAVKQVFDSCRNAGQSPNNTNKIVDGIYKAVQGMGTNEDSIFAALTATKDFNTFCSAVKNYKTTYGTDLYTDLDGDIDEETVWSQISRILRGLRQPITPQTTRPAPQQGQGTRPPVKPKPSNFVDPKVKLQQMMQGQTTRPTAPQPAQGTRPTAPQPAQGTRPTAPQPAQGTRPTPQPAQGTRPAPQPAQGTRPAPQPGPNLSRR